ncbi:MAG: bactofilin family protein [Balneolaceae bacterium]
MFGKEDKKNMNGTQTQSPSLNMISEGSTLTGKINSETDIRIAGLVDGEILSKGKAIVTSSGKVEGDVAAADADVAGTISGKIVVSNKLIIRQSALVEGDIYTKTLIVEEGGQINGSCHMGKEVAKAEKEAPVREKELENEKA